ncbi:uncharacterized protein LOC128256628 [Drosophila gunungcola]|uniref:HSF-type DNA-binding domain-containing protein n=1 Tax=Drosophila gunungcola TaxID=103775 RepID=A0A9P9YG38_9MUSC|nr:uncharacterized protein LOC128256628 [Drosophila gunungcola]KAI8035948.1 hypothetical protein M5D96_011379 [Drosophila gunungcola]
MSGIRTKLRGQQKVKECVVGESADEVEEIAATSRGNGNEQLESRSSPENLDYLEFEDTLETQHEFSDSASAVREAKPTARTSKTNSAYNSNINQEAVEDHRRIYRQLGIRIPESPSDHPLMGYRFVLKLFLATSSDSVGFLNWSTNGRQLELDYEGLQEHLSSGCSIFHCRSPLQFTGLLLAHGFERREGATPADRQVSSILLIYQNPIFARGQSLQKLQTLVEEGQGIEDQDAEKKEPRLPSLHLPNAAHIARMSRRGDLCSTSFTSRSPLQVARCQFQTLLGHQADLGVLRERNSNDLFNKQILAQLNVKRGRSAFNNALFDLTTSKGTSSAKFVRPHESVINIGIGQAPDYAGYYGKVELSKVNDFFAEYLPRYGSKITGYKDIVMDATNKSTGFQQNLPIGMDYSDDEDDGLAPISSGPEMDFLPSTSAAGKLKSSGGKAVEDSDLEQAMQELCGGSNLNQEEDEGPQTSSSSSSSSSSKLKAKPKPQANAKPQKRVAKFLESSSSDSEDSPVLKETKSNIPKIIKLKTEEDSISYIVEIEVDSEMHENAEPIDGKANDQQCDDDDEDEDEDEDDEEDELDEDDDDYIDKNTHYKNAPELPKRQRYNLRTPKRNPL